MFFANQHIYIGESILTEKYEHNTFKWQLYLPEPIHLQINFVLTCNVKEDIYACFSYPLGYYPTL